MSDINNVYYKPNITVKKNNSKSIMTPIDFISGALAGITQVLVGQPFDIVKVRLQTSNTKTSIFKVIKEIIITEKIKGFYKGTSSPLIGMSFAVANQFAGFEMCKKMFRNMLKLEDYHTLPIIYIMLSGGFGGFLYSLIVCPMELFRIRLQLQTKDTLIKYNSALHAAKDIYNNYGIKGCYKGYVPTLFREVIGGIVYFGVYEHLVNAYSEIFNGRKNIPNTFILLFGAASGFFLWLFVLPIDVVKSKIQGADFIDTRYKYFLRTFNYHLYLHGYKGMFKGIFPTLIRAPIVNAASFLVYEKTSQYLNNKL